MQGHNVESPRHWDELFCRPGHRKSPLYEARAWNATTVITIKDNDSVFYEKLQGTWKMTAYEVDTENGGYLASETWTVKVIGFDEGEEGYDKVLYITGMLGYEWTMLQVNYHFDMETKKGYLEVPYGTVFAEKVNFSGLGECDVIAGGLTEDGYIDLESSFKGEWNDEFNLITFDENAQLWGFIPHAASGKTYLWFAYGKFTMTR